MSKDALSGRLPGSFSSQLDPFVCSTVLFVCFGLGFALGVSSASSVSSVSSAELPVWAGIIYSCLAVSCVKLFVQMRLCVWKMFMNERDKWPNVSAVCVCVCVCMQDIKIKIIAGQTFISRFSAVSYSQHD